MNKTETSSEYLRKSFFNLFIPLWNKIPSKLLNPNVSYISMKMKLRHHFRRRYRFELENPEHSKNAEGNTVSINTVHYLNLLVIFIIASIMLNLLLSTLPFK